MFVNLFRNVLIQSCGALLKTAAPRLLKHTPVLLTSSTFTQKSLQKTVFNVEERAGNTWSAAWRGIQASPQRSTQCNSTPRALTFHSSSEFFLFLLSVWLTSGKRLLKFSASVAWNEEVVLPNWEREAWALKLLTPAPWENQSDCFHLIFHFHSSLHSTYLSFQHASFVFSNCNDEFARVPISGPLRPSIYQRQVIFLQAPNVTANTEPVNSDKIIFIVLREDFKFPRLTIIISVATFLRSEERRVGKECPV